MVRRIPYFRFPLSSPLGVLLLLLGSCAAQKPEMPGSETVNPRSESAAVAPSITVTPAQQAGQSGGTAPANEPTVAQEGSHPAALSGEGAVTPEADVSRVNPSMVDTSDIVITTGKHLSIPKEGASESPRNDNIHDTYNNAIAVLQNPAKAMADFPRDRRHQVDWVKALDQGVIQPRSDIKGETDMLVMDMDIMMKNTQFMPWVRFPHLQHTKWLACENCHPKIFIPQQDANPISMNKVLRGQYCGVCHDKVAFSLFVCERCHSVPHEGSGPKWW